MRRQKDRVQPGMLTARVVDNVDPQGGGRVLVAVALSDGSQPTERWARLATLSAGDQRGTWLLPAVGDEVLLAFEAGDVARPIVVGSLWATGDAPPETGPGRTDRTTIRTRSGAVIRIEDGAAPTITIETGSGDSVVLGPAGITVSSPGTVVVSAGVGVELQGATVDINTGMARFSGTVKCDTLIANNVVATSYTPGAGNLW
jgi:phage baseplate assembly protein gpV